MPSRLPRPLQPWFPMANVAELQHGVSALLGLAVCWRETIGGQSPALDLMGPGGTGDRVPRRWKRYVKREGAAQILKRWTPPKPTKDNPNQEELCMPADGRGWGRGLFQHDLMGDGSEFAGLTNTAWCLQKLPDDRFVWEDPMLNTDRAFVILRACLDAFDSEEELAACGFNAGIPHVQNALLSVSEPATKDKRYLAANWVTTGHNYGSDVIARKRRLFDALNTPPPEDPHV